MNPYASINIIKNILDSNNVDYFLEGNTLYLKEKNNHHLYHYLILIQVIGFIYRHHTTKYMKP